MLNDPVLMNDWHVVAYAPDLREGQPMTVRLLGEDLVLWRVGEKIHAWRDLCLHRGTRLSLGRIEQDCLICPYHGWTYDEQGQCISYPAHPDQTPSARAHAKVYRACERYNWIWVMLLQYPETGLKNEKFGIIPQSVPQADPLYAGKTSTSSDFAPDDDTERDVPAFPQWDDASFRKVYCGPYTYKASGPRAIENFLDVTHFPFVHQGFLGDPAYPEVNDYEAEITPEGVVASNISVWQPDPDGTGQGARVNYTYKVLRPLTATFVKSSAGPRFAMFFVVTPVSEDLSIAHAYVAMDYSDLTDEEIRQFQDKITLQDVPIVESQRPELLPLDLQAELHLRSDRTAIAYRKWLSELGLTFGTA
jgi:phenylpropionate dioxygenase-like ring-hydroxylating dioxygenase large terminal subunit